jgi:hypothetical protein
MRRDFAISVAFKGTGNLVPRMRHIAAVLRICDWFEWFCCIANPNFVRRPTGRASLSSDDFSLGNIRVL